MWARYAEVILACWLASSPFLLGHATQDTWRWTNDLFCAALVAACALLSYRPALDKLHLVNAGVGLWLVAAGLLTPAAPAGLVPDASSAAQNWIVVGLLLLMLGILPSRATRPPRAWEAFLQRRERRAPP